MIHELDIVELTESHEDWPAGTEGTVVDELGGGDTVLVEIDDGDETLKLVPVERSALRLRWSASPASVLPA